MKNIKLAKISVLFMMICVMIFSFSYTVSAEEIPDSDAEIITVAANRTETVSTKREEPKNMGRIILTAAGISIVVSLCSVIYIFHSYKTNGQSEPYPYDKKAPLELTEREDIMIDRKVERERINHDEPPRR